MASRGAAEFEDYVRSLSARKADGDTLTESEQDWYVQGVIAGACKSVKDSNEE